MPSYHTHFLAKCQVPLERGRITKPSERASRQDVRYWFSNSEALKGGYVKDLRPRVDPVGIPPRKERAPGRHRSLPVRATELNQLSHPNALRSRWDQRAGALVASNPQLHAATSSTTSHSAYKLQRKQIRRYPNSTLTGRRSPRNPEPDGEEKERCLRQYYIRATRLHHPEGDSGGRHEGRKWFHS